MSDIDIAFEENTTIKKSDHGYKVDCKKGFWGVSAPTKEAALSEARYYFMQYYRDGEYSQYGTKKMSEAHKVLFKELGL